MRETETQGERPKEREAGKDTKKGRRSWEEGGRGGRYGDMEETGPRCVAGAFSLVAALKAIPGKEYDHIIEVALATYSIESPHLLL